MSKELKELKEPKEEPKGPTLESKKGPKTTTDVIENTNCPIFLRSKFLKKNISVIKCTTNNVIMLIMNNLSYSNLTA